MYPEHSTHQQTFEGGMNSDLADELMPRNVARVFLNCRVLSSAGGNVGVVTNVAGNVLITTPLPDGTNKTIGSAADERNNRFYFVVYNSNGYHRWLYYDELLNTVTVFFTSKTDSDGVDILRLDPDYPVLHIDIVIGTNQVTGQENTLIYFCDALNKGRKMNVQKCLDKTATGYGYVITEDYITQYKKAPDYAPVVANSAPTGISGYWTDFTRNSNFIYAQLFKFCYRYVYDDGEVSNYSDWSRVALPPNQSYEGAGSITNDSNCIAVLINTGSPLVVKIEIAMLTTGAVTTNGVTLQGATLEWQTIAILNKDEQNIPDSSNYSYNFYNDGAYIGADQDKINRPYSFMFRVPICQSFTGLAMTHTGGDEGFPRVPIAISVKNNPIPLFIPAGTVNTANHPSITVTQISYTTDSEAFVVSRYNPTILFTIGADVKKGNVFTIKGTDSGYLWFIPENHRKGKPDNYNFTYTATLADTAVSVANRIAAYLRAIGRGPIFNQSTDIDGNASFYFTYVGQYQQNITKFTGSAVAIQFATLQNNGISVQVIKSGSIRQYAAGYEDDDGRKSDAYTDDGCIIRTPFLTEAPGGVLQQPVHTVTLSHQPPVWAKRWILYRTPDESSYIQLLVQQVIDVSVIVGADVGEYLDLVIGSLFTYNQIHKDSVLAYQFTRGDRLRLITDTNTGLYYTPFFETEVLSYNEVTTEVRNAQITVNGTDHVVPTDAVLPDYVGKNIQIAGYERTIVGIDGTAYVLDQIINIGPTMATVIEPNYTFVDRRGIVRIAKPPATYTVADFSTVEIYTPQVTTSNLDYKNFNDTAQKFDILNFGTETRAHAGSHQNQDGTSADTLVSTPAIVLVTEGDSYIRDREMPTNNTIVDTQIIVEAVEDPNFSDFYPSSLNNLGRVYPKDNGSGKNHFGSRTRFSNDFIVDTAVNGLNDFNNLDREDYNDANGDVMLTKCRENKLHLYKQLKVGWLPLFQSIINTVTGQQFIGTADKLLGPIQYHKFGDGIGNHPESWGETDNYMYHAAPNAGVFCQLTGEGIEPISKIYGFDYDGRAVLSQVKKYNVKLPFGSDKQNDLVWWSMPEFIEPIFNNPMTGGDWQTTLPAVPGGSTPIIVTQPVNGVVTYDEASGNFLINMNEDYVGNDTFTYKFQLPDESYTAAVNVCISSVEPDLGPSSYRMRVASAYCVQDGGVNNGLQGWTTLEGYYLIDGSLTGFIMPNIQNISPDAIVPDGSVITYNFTNIAPPTGSSLNDIWYNAPSDALYKNLGGDAWKLLTNKVVNTFYLAPQENTDACPIGYTAISLKFSASSDVACTSALKAIYISGAYTDIAPGITIYNDAALTTPTTGYNYVVSLGGIIYNIGFGTGVVGAATGDTCGMSFVRVIHNSCDGDVFVTVHNGGGDVVAEFSVAMGATHNAPIPTGNYDVYVQGVATYPFRVQVTANSDTQVVNSGVAAYFPTETAPIFISVTLSGE